MFLDSMNDPKALLKRTVSVCVMMLAAWAALIGTITLVLLVAIAQMKSAGPASVDVQTETQPSTDLAPTTSPKSDGFRPARGSAQPKTTTRI